ncbi:MAG: hypothetical protein AAGA12_01675 [Pseudomonadota bacterium]
MFFTFEVLYPRQYARLQTEAEEWNRENWKTGTALRVSVQVSSSEATGRTTATATATLDCYQKRFARPGGLKGRPGVHTVIRQDGPAHLIVPFGPNAAHYTPLRDVCSDALRGYVNWRLPHVTESHYYWSHIVANDQSFNCFLGNDPRTSQGQVTRPTFMNVEEVPLRTLISADEYEALPHGIDNPHQHSSQSYYWWTENVETTCWRFRFDDACTRNVNEICGTPYR